MRRRVAAVSLGGISAVLISSACLLALGQQKGSLHADMAPRAEQANPPALPAPYTPTYAKDGGLMAPKDYREWVFLSSGLDMSYSPRAAASGMQGMFDNVFVNPAAYRSFVEKGTWPDKTVLVLEVRGAESKGSINTSGHYQGASMGYEVHVKDEARFPGKWAFFEFDNDVSGKLLPQTAACYSCHAEHGAVDTTFVQFYPTLLPIAHSQGTLSAAYLKEIATPDNK